MNQSLDSSTRSGVDIEVLKRHFTGFKWLYKLPVSFSSERFTVDIFGYLNPLRTSQIQVISNTELEWIYSLTENELDHSPPFDSNDAKLLILSQDCVANPALLSVCERKEIAVAEVSLNGDEIIGILQNDLPRLLRERKTEHGVFLAVKNTGILLTGTSGIGKSEVALDLVQRGHQLVADDAVSLYRTESGELIGECAELLQGYLEIRGLGIINVLKMFGPSAVLTRYRLQLIINLKDAAEVEIHDIDRLRANLHDQILLGVKVPCLTMMVAPGRNLSVLVEAAVRDHLLRSSGIDSSVEFLDQHDRLMQQSSNSP